MDLPIIGWLDFYRPPFRRIPASTVALGGTKRHLQGDISLAEPATPFFGIGAMRAGTTLLTTLLESYPDCGMMPIKELHFFDVRHGKYPGVQLYRSMAKRLAALSQNIVDRVGVALDELRAEAKEERAVDYDLNGLTAKRNFIPWTDEIRGRFFALAKLDRDLREIADIVDFFSIRDFRSYVDYLRRNSVGAAAFGEITPAYGLLPATAFMEMDSLFPNVCFIFIMRDPVDRLWSHVRYKADRAELKGRKPGDINTDFRDTLQQPDIIGRSSYQDTIKELEKAIPTQRILYLFYETLTSPETGPAEIRRIEAALGLKHREANPGFFSKPINASSPAKLTPENEAVAMQLFSPVYAFVEKRFGQQPGWRLLRESP